MEHPGNGLHAVDVFQDSGPNSSDLKLSRYLISVAAPGSSLQKHQIVFSTRSVCLVAVPQDVWELLERGAIGQISQETISNLVDNKVLVDVREDELSCVVDENRSAVGSKSVLDEVIQPSAACQLGCGYCGQEHEARHMASHVQDLLIDSIAQRLTSPAREQPFERLNVGWFGGEPLLGIRAMRRLSPKLRKLADDSSCLYSSHVVTNGLLLTETLALELEDQHSVRKVEVTLDGPRQSHDVRRATKSGKGSFDKIFKNLLAVARNPRITFDIAVRCNVDKQNSNLVPELVSLLAKAGLQQRISVYFSPVYSWGNDAHFRSHSDVEYAELEIYWLSLLSAQGFRVDYLPSRKKVVCIAVEPSSRVTDAFGVQFNCTEVPYVPSYGSPNRFQVKNLLDARSAADLHFQDWNDRIAERDPALWCHSCPILPVCGGACPKAWNDGVPPCPSIKTNLSERILLHTASALRSTPGAGD